MYKKLILPLMLLAAAGTASAQQTTTTTSTPAKTTTTRQTAPALTPAQKAALVKQNQQTAANAQAIAQLVDQGKAGEVWDQGSTVEKAAVTRDAFVSGVDAQRSKVGTMQSRKLARVTRSLSKGGKLPAGYYINVAFATTFSNEKQPVRELVSFHLDSDKAWRVSGYTLR